MANTAPTVTTQNCTAVLGTTATGNGTITATGGINPTVEGVCYMVGTSGDPTTANFTAFNSGSFGVGAYTVSMTGLTPGTNYRVRAYATNTKGTGYGTTVQMRTANTLGGIVSTSSRVLGAIYRAPQFLQGAIASITSIFGSAGGTGYWGITGVTAPQHYWPFSQTGNYTDQGTTGGLDLTAQGTGNSFSNGLVLNGSGWANGTSNADVCDLGSTFSLLYEVTFSTTGNNFILGLTDAYYGNTGGIFSGFDSSDRIVYYRQDASVDDIRTAVSSYPPGTYQVILVYSGGQIKLYVNGSPITSGAFPATISAPLSFNQDFGIGAANKNGSFAFIGTIKRAGVLKGTAWSVDNVADIYDGPPPALGVNLTIQKMLSSLIVCGTAILGDVTRIAGAVVQNIGGIIISACSLVGNMRQVFNLQGMMASTTAMTGRLVLRMPLSGVIRSSTAVIGKIKLGLHFGGVISSGTAILGAVGRFALRFLSGTIACSTAVTARLIQWLHLSGIISSGTSLVINVHTIGSQFLSGLITCATAVSGGIVSSRFFGGVIQCSTALTGMIGRGLYLAGNIISTSTILGGVQRFPAQLLGGIITCGTVIQGGLNNIGAKLIGGVITCGTYVYMGFLGSFPGAAAHGRRFVGGIYHWYVRAKEHLNIKD